MFSLKKRYVATAGGFLCAGLIGGILLRDKDRRIKFMKKINEYKRDILHRREYKHYSVLEEAGIPDQLDRIDLAQIENAKMVSEGSQYGINYYNEIQEERSGKVKG